MKKLQVPLLVLLLLAVVFGMNTVADMRQKQAKALTKEAEKTKEAATAAAAAKNAPPTEGHKGGLRAAAPQRAHDGSGEGGSLHQQFQ